MVLYALRRRQPRARRRHADLAIRVDDRTRALSRVHGCLSEAEWATVPDGEHAGMLAPPATAGSRARAVAWTRILRCREALVLLIALFLEEEPTLEIWRIPAVEPAPLVDQLVADLVAAPGAPPRRGASLLAA